MRVLVISQGFPSAKAPELGIVALRQAKALQALGHEFLVVRLVPHLPLYGSWKRRYRAIPDYEVVEGIQVRTLRAFYAPRMMWLEHFHRQLDRPLARIVREFKPDLIHAHYLLTSGHTAVQQALPTVVTAHGSDAYDWAWRRAGLRQAAADTVKRATIVVAVSAFIRARVRALYERDVEVVYNGADETTFYPRDRRASREALGIAPDRFVVAYAGGVTAAKGVPDLLNAAGRLSKLHPVVLLAGNARGSIRLPITEGVEMKALGQIPHGQLATAFAAADVVALPSYHEGLPLVLCEAMLMGIPVLASRVGGIPEIVKDGFNGYLVSAGDIDAISLRLSELASDKALRARMGAAGRSFSAEHLTWSLNARRYDALYHRAAQNGIKSSEMASCAAT